MKLIPLILVISIFVSILPLSEGTQGDHSLNIDSLTISFDKTDADFTVNYHLGTIPKLYILLMGGKSIEPKIKDYFPNMDYNIVKIDQEKAILHVKNISRYDKNLNYYLHDSIKFGATIDTVIIYIPGDDRPTEYTNIDATPNKFYRQ